MATIAENGGRSSLLDETDFIQKRREELYEREHLCPVNTSRNVYDCTRMGASCPATCPHIARWQKNHVVMDDYCG